MVKNWKELSWAGKSYAEESVAERERQLNSNKLDDWKSNLRWKNWSKGSLASALSLRATRFFTHCWLAAHSATTWIIGGKTGQWISRRSFRANSSIVFKVCSPARCSPSHLLYLFQATDWARSIVFNGLSSETCTNSNSMNDKTPWTTRVWTVQ